MTYADIRARIPPSNAVYAAFWRWHFYAGLVILPLLMLMALTGGLYLFRGEIDALVYKPLTTVADGPRTISPQAWVDAAQRTGLGRVVQLTAPADGTASARLTVEAADGARRDVFVDPHEARVLGDIPSGGIMQVVKRLHSLDLAGKVANLLVEIVAGWAIVMVATGLFLWWPRGQSGGIVSVRGAPRQRLFWRDLHAVTGLFAAGVILFLAVTGMPWSAVWGAQVRKLTNDAGWGAPRPPAGATQTWSHAEHGGDDATPWAMQGMDMAMHHAPASSTPTLDQVVDGLDAAGLPRPYVVSIPQAPGKAWSATHSGDHVENTRTIYFDGANGVLLDDVAFDRYGPAAKAISWGISVHQGQEYGPVNRYLMLLGCIAVWLLGISATIMWWKRRPSGRLAAPPRPADRRAYLALAAVVVPLGLIYPLTGASLLIVLAIDLLIRRIARTMRAPLETQS